MTQPDPDKEATFKEITFSGDLHAARGAADAIVQEAEAAEYTVDAVFAIKLALEEAITNAVRHGNGADPTKEIMLRYAVSPEKCAIVVRDEGQGFNPDRVPDCTHTERLPLPYGRGIMLMRAYMDRVAYRRHGSEIYLMKRNE
ncbi:MAG: ATP-binding protein [bacterium]|nr:ATP-binding protein [bacterium]